MDLRAAEPSTVEHPPANWQNSTAAIAVFQCLVFLIAFLIIFSRRPDALLNAQFWAEDGKYWYADAYHFGWRSLLTPYNGYLHVPTRLIALFTLLFPFSIAPLLMNLCAISIQILPVSLFLSSRFSFIPMSIRLTGSFLYLALPNSYETNANLTNMQWRLAVLALLVLLAQPPGRRAWRIFDVAVLLALGFDSVLAILFLPIAAYLRWRTNDKLHDWHLAALAPGAVIQTALVLFSHSRPAPPNGANVQRLVGILGGQIFVPSILGFKTALLMYLTGDKAVFTWLRVVATLLGFAVVLYCLWRSPLPLKLFTIFAAVLLAVALRSPMVSPTSVTPQWELLQFPGLGNRYYLLPMLAFLACLVWMLRLSPKRKTSLENKLARFVALAVLAILPFGIYRDWRHPQFKEFHFQQFAAEFENAAPGTRITIPLNPTGWQMELVRK